MMIKKREIRRKMGRRGEYPLYQYHSVEKEKK